MGYETIIPRVVKAFDWLVSAQQWNRLDQHLYKLDRLKDGVFFVEIGSNDGKMFDPVYDFVKSGSWSGVMVEPIECYFKQLRENYKNSPNLILENVAISSKQEIREFYRIEDGHDFLPRWTHGLGSFYKDVLLSHERVIPGLRKYIVTQQVECISFDDLLSRHSINHLDVLVVDTEGYDYQIIRQVDFETYQPAIVVYEHKHLDHSDQMASRELLASQGYTLEKHLGNTLAWKY
ncbi:MAG: FkbM family methyltransferase [Gammaproteobacteria bacterium]|nr:FkbM family methyltransferase [Gammaproteobacteria bacterium]